MAVYVGQAVYDYDLSQIINMYMEIFGVFLENYFNIFILMFIYLLFVVLEFFGVIGYSSHGFTCPLAMQVHCHRDVLPSHDVFPLKPISHMKF